MQIKPLLQPRN